MTLSSELRRRDVFRVSGVYAIVGWLLLHVAGSLEEAMALPAWFDSFVLTILLIGSSLAAIFAWAFKLTPEGLKRTAEVDSEDSITAQTGSWLAAIAHRYDMHCRCEAVSAVRNVFLVSRRILHAAANFPPAAIATAMALVGKSPAAHNLSPTIPKIGELWRLAGVALWMIVAGNAAAQGTDERPNILLVLLDDVGFMDFGAYGSDTSTPTIDGLAEAGVMFTRYYTQPLCGPSRASLLTGQDNHRVGAGTLAEALTPEMRELPAYSMRWQDDQQTVASRLRASGYQTFVTGKWGVGDVGANLPHRFGFDRSWVLDATGSSNYRAKPYIPLYKEVKWFEDGEQVALPDDFYSSRAIVDKMIEYVDDADPARPFFAYLAFQAVHIPVQVQQAYVDGYDGVFDRGWDVLREQRLQRAIDLGLVPETTRLAEPAHHARQWQDLSDDEKRYWARAMQVNAGMMEAADHHLGRLLNHLDAKGVLENTVVVVTSDNGPEYNTMGKGGMTAELASVRLWMALEGWDVEYDNLGQPGSLAAIGQEWAAVSAAPFHLFKFSAAEGGVRVPLVVAGPGVANLGIVHARAQVADLAPTLLEVAGVGAPVDGFYGRSLAPVLTAEANAVYGDQDSFVIEVSGTAAVFRGYWKLTRTPEPYGDNAWHLYDLSRDPGETQDLAAQQPDLAAELKVEYERYARDVGVYELAPGETARERIGANGLRKFAKNYWYLFVAMLAVFVLLVPGCFLAARRLFSGLSR